MEVGVRHSYEMRGNLMKNLDHLLLLLLALLTAHSGVAGAPVTLHEFTGVDGAIPYAGLFQGNDGNLYGTTQSGGTSANCPGGGGTIFRVTLAGSLTTLYSFNGAADGANPQAGVAQGSDGNFYGTTYAGGASNVGTIYKITSAGALTPLYSFTGGSDGGNPQAGLAQGTDGNFYGTTSSGGNNTNCQGGCGTLFKVSASGNLTTLYSFT